MWNIVVAEIWKHDNMAAMRVNRQKKNMCLDVHEGCKEARRCQVSTQFKERKK